MKKRLLLLLVAVSSTAIMWAEAPGFTWSVGVEAATNYLWRGINLGGLAFQPDVTLGYKGLEIENWWNLSPTDWSFKEFNPEMDILISYKISFFKIGVNHQHYFNGNKYFRFKGGDFLDNYTKITDPSVAADYSYKGVNYQYNTYNTNQTEVFAEFDFEDLIEKLPLHVGWYTYVAGDDMTIDETKNTITTDGDTIPGLKRMYSTYIDVAYRFDLPLGFSITPRVGMSPWKSLYSYENPKFNITNIELRADWEMTFASKLNLDVYALVMFNTAGVNKDNILTKIKDQYDNQRLNATIGASITIGNNL